METEGSLKMKLCFLVFAVHLTAAGIMQPAVTYAGGYDKPQAEALGTLNSVLVGPHRVVQGKSQFMSGLCAKAGVAGEAGPDGEAGHCRICGAGGR